MTNHAEANPRTDFESFCKECGLAFGLVDDSPLRNTCGDCFSKLGRPALDCDDCGRAIPPGEKFHLHRMRWCQDCAKRNSVDDATWYECQTTAWSD